MSIRAAIYARVSSVAQREKHTIDSQLRVLRGFVQAHGWSVAGEYIDDGRSAKTGKLEARDGFARLVRDAEAKLFEVLLVVDIDRLTRTSDSIERAQILGPFQRLGIDIVTPNGGRLDLDSFIGGLYVELQARFAAEENRKRAERIKAGKARAIAEGRKPAGPTPYGLVYSRELAKWSIHEAAATIVREIYARVIDGEACQSIADDLNVRDVPPRGRGPWTREKVYKIARSTHVLGSWVADKRTHAKMPVPRIIDDLVWHEAQAKLMEHGKRGLRRTRYVYLLEGMATCGACGEPIAIRSPTPQRRGLIGAPAYVCRGRKYEQRGPRCTAPILRVDDVDARVWAKVERTLRGPDLAGDLERRFAARAANHRDWSADVERYRAKLEQLARAESGMLSRYQQGMISESGFDEALRKLGADRAVAARQLQAAEDAVRVGVPQEPAADVLARLRALADNGTQIERQRVVRTIIEPGSTVFRGTEICFTLEVAEESGADDARAGGSQGLFLVSPAGYRTPYGKTRPNSLKLQQVA